MKFKSTNDLHKSLKETTDLNKFLSENQEQFRSESISDILYTYFIEKNISKAKLAKQAGMSDIYLHQIFSGRRNPSRNRLLCLCYGLNISLEEAQQLLVHCVFAQLYPKSKWDAIISYGLIHQMNLFEINDKLFAEDEETLL